MRSCWPADAFPVPDLLEAVAERFTLTKEFLMEQIFHPQQLAGLP